MPEARVGSGGVAGITGCVAGCRAAAVATGACAAPAGGLGDGGGVATTVVVAACGGAGVAAGALAARVEREGGVAVAGEALVDVGGDDVGQDGLDLIGAHRLREQHLHLLARADPDRLSGGEDDLLALATTNGGNEAIDGAQHQRLSSSGTTVRMHVELSRYT